MWTRHYVGQLTADTFKIHPIGSELKFFLRTCRRDRCVSFLSPLNLQAVLVNMSFDVTKKIGDRFGIEMCEECLANGEFHNNFVEDINIRSATRFVQTLFRRSLSTVFQTGCNWQRESFRNWLDANVDRVYIRVNLPATCADPQMTWPACT